MPRQSGLIFVLLDSSTRRGHIDRAVPLFLHSDRFIIVPPLIVVHGIGGGDVGRLFLHFVDRFLLDRPGQSLRLGADPHLQIVRGLDRGLELGGRPRHARSDAHLQRRIGSLARLSKGILLSQRIRHLDVSDLHRIFRNAIFHPPTFLITVLFPVFADHRPPLVVRELPLDQWRSVQISAATAPGARQNVLAIYGFHALRFEHPSGQRLGARLGARGQGRGGAAVGVGTVRSFQLSLRYLGAVSLRPVRVRFPRLVVAPGRAVYDQGSPLVVVLRRYVGSLGRNGGAFGGDGGGGRAEAPGYAALRAAHGRVVVRVVVIHPGLPVRGSRPAAAQSLGRAGGRRVLETVVASRRAANALQALGRFAERGRGDGGDGRGGFDGGAGRGGILGRGRGVHGQALPLEGGRVLGVYLGSGHLERSRAPQRHAGRARVARQRALRAPLVLDARLCQHLWTTQRVRSHIFRLLRARSVLT